MPKLQLGFHGTFALKKSNLLKFLALTTTNSLDKAELGVKKISAMKGWAIRAGLLDKEGSLTSEGKIITEKDPYLESPITDWFIHFNLSFGSNTPLQRIPESPSILGGWSYFVYTFLPQFEQFTLDSLSEESSKVFATDSPVSVKKNFRILIRAYSEKDGIAGCQFIKKINKSDYRVNFLKELQPFTPYLIGYVLAMLWKRDFEKQQSVLLDEIVKQKMGLKSVFGINAHFIDRVIDSLEECEIIQRRSAQPYLIGSKPNFDSKSKHIQILKLWDNPLELLNQAYENDSSLPNRPLIDVLNPFLPEEDAIFPFLKCEIIKLRLNHAVS